LAFSAKKSPVDARGISKSSDSRSLFWPFWQISEPLLAISFPNLVASFGLFGKKIPSRCQGRFKGLFYFRSKTASFPVCFSPTFETEISGIFLKK
jgi:hypothetical protein